ncbi:hypothetical protein [Flindersiella endophytica]
MNDLSPPPRRSIPEYRRIRMRDELDNEMHSIGRRDSRLRRFGVPIVAAAAVVGLAAGGYALFGGNGREINPAGDRSTASATPTTTPTTPTTTSPPKTQHPTPNRPPTKQTDPDQPTKSLPASDANRAYRICIGLARDHGDVMGEPVSGLSGKLAIENDEGITAVVANSTDAYTCNVKPDTAVSPPRPLDSAVSPETFAIANNVTSNVLPGDRGDMFWGGGGLPNGVNSITYTFADGHHEQATVKNGFWAMQYFSAGPMNGASSDPVKVSVDGPGGQRELTLRWGDHTCNQVSHGC